MYCLIFFVLHSISLFSSQPKFFYFDENNHEQGGVVVYNEPLKITDQRQWYDNQKRCLNPCILAETRIITTNHFKGYFVAKELAFKMDINDSYSKIRTSYADFFEDQFKKILSSLELKIAFRESLPFASDIQHDLNNKFKDHCELRVKNREKDYCRVYLGRGGQLLKDYEDGLASCLFYYVVNNVLYILHTSNVCCTFIPEKNGRIEDGYGGEDTLSDKEFQGLAKFQFILNSHELTKPQTLFASNHLVYRDIDTLLQLPTLRYELLTPRERFEKVCKEDTDSVDIRLYCGLYRALGFAKYLENASKEYKRDLYPVPFQVMEARIAYQPPVVTQPQLNQSIQPTMSETAQIVKSLSAQLQQHKRWSLAAVWQFCRKLVFNNFLMRKFGFGLRT